jgi:hypothetical protein
MYPAMLHDSGKEIRLSVPFTQSEVMERRFVGRGARWADDPDYSRQEYQVPDVVWFADHSGHLCLISPHRTSASWGSSAGVDEGSASFRFVVAAGRRGRTYRRINGMRTHLQGLDEWIPLSAVSHEREGKTGGGHRDILTLEAQPSVRVGRRLNAAIENWYSFSIHPHPGQSTFTDRVHMRTDVSTARTWDEHLDVHNGLRQLLTVAGWQRYGFTDVEVQQRSDPQTVLSGESIGARWAPVYTYALERPTEIDRSRFLFTFDDIGASGVARWFALRDDFGRAIAGMIHAVGRTESALETTFSETAAAMEHLGHRIGVENGESPGQKIRVHLRRITRELHADTGFDLDEWVLRLADTYRSLKHPDHDDPDSLVLLNLLRETRLVFRAWVAMRLGINRSALESNLKVDPMARPYERL